MPSPIAHASVVLVVQAIVEHYRTLRSALHGRAGFFYVAAIVALLAPDIDFLISRFFDDPTVGHGGATHSIALGLVFGLAFAGGCRARYGAELPVVGAWAVGTGCAWSHTLFDMATWGRGVMLLWPLSLERLRIFPVFYGARHSQPTAWRLHLITLSTELLFVVVLWALVRRISRRA